MRILTLTQPWATLMAAGAKTIETRSWRTKYRGPVAIHAAQGVHRDFAEMCFRTPFASALAESGYDKPEDLPRGAIVGVVELVECRPMVGTWTPRGVACVYFADSYIPEAALCICGGAGHTHVLTKTERAFGHYEIGRFAWITDPAKRIRLKTPMVYKGAQGLRTVPPAIIPDLLSGLGAF